jgi:hypothetical protein
MIAASMGLLAAPRVDGRSTARSFSTHVVANFRHRPCCKSEDSPEKAVVLIVTTLALSPSLPYMRLAPESIHEDPSALSILLLERLS